MNPEERRSLGFLNAELVPRPEWISTRISELYLDLSTCHGHVSPDALPLHRVPERISHGINASLLQVEIGVSVRDAEALRAEEGLSDLPLINAPNGIVLGYEVLGVDVYGMGWHTQHCHNIADAPEGASIHFNELGLIGRFEDATSLATWCSREESGTEPVFWIAVSVHKVEHNGQETPDRNAADASHEASQ